MRKEHYYLLAGVLIGFVAAPQLRRLPIISKLPSA